MSNPQPWPADARAILHVDMDAFFASVEQRDDPSLRGKPVLVGGAGKRGVVAAASYEARVFGCRSAMPTAVALRLCPQAIVLKGSFARYSEVSRQVFEILGEFTPIVEPLSVDEAYLDVTGSQQLLGSPLQMAQSIRARIREHTELTASVGVASSKMLAKIGSDANKPDGLTIIWPGSEAQFLAQRPVGVIPGLGPATEKRLHAMGLRTVGQIASASVGQLEAVFGEHAQSVRERANGLDDRPVRTERERKSISQERTFAEDLQEPDQARALLLWHVECVAHRLRSKGLVASGISLKLRYGDFVTINRSATLDGPTDRTDLLWAAAQEVFEAWVRSGWRPLRLLGFGVERLSSYAESLGGQQGGLFDQGEKASAIDKVKDTLIDRFGPDAIRSAGALQRPRRDRGEER